MSSTPAKNPAASVKQRLLNYARGNQLDFNAVLIRYAVERILFRLSESEHAGEFYLKGAMLFVLWESNPHRPTKDLDLLFIPKHDRNQISRIFREVAAVEVAGDGLCFDPESVIVEDIREENAYGGLRVKLSAHLDSGRIPLQIDVGLGDSVYPETGWADFPPLLDSPPVRIRAYPIETVVAEKFQAIVELGLRNSRMKDYYDIHYLLKKFHFSGQHLREAIRQTFLRRKTDIPIKPPIGLTEGFWGNTQRQTQWRAFLRKNGLEEAGDLPKVGARIESFLLPTAMDPRIVSREWRPEDGWIPRV